MDGIKETPLGKFRQKAQWVTYGAVALCAVFVFITLIYSSAAQSNYSSYLSTDTYLYEYERASSASSAFGGAASVAGAVASISILAWIASSLLIANKQTTLVPQASVPIELEDREGSIAPPIGTKVTFKKSGESLDVFTIEGEPVGSLSGELSKRVLEDTKNKSIRAFVTTYHAEHPVIEISACC